MWGETPDTDGQDQAASYIQRYQDQTYELRYTDQVSRELQVYQSQLNQVLAVQNYAGYLEQIRKNAERIQMCRSLRIQIPLPIGTA